MKQFVTDLWTDPAKFAAAVRALVFAVATLMQQGAIPGAGTALGWYVTLAAQALALGVAAGQKNEVKR